MRIFEQGEPSMPPGQAQPRQEFGGGSGQPAEGPPGDGLPLTRTTRDGRLFLVADDVLLRIESPLSISRGGVPPYWDALRTGDYGEVEAQEDEEVEVPWGQGRHVEWLVSPQGAMLIAFLEREAWRASAERAFGVSRSISRAFPECNDLNSVDLRMVAVCAGLLKEGSGGSAGPGSPYSAQSGSAMDAFENEDEGSCDVGMAEMESDEEEDEDGEDEENGKMQVEKVEDEDEDEEDTLVAGEDHEGRGQRQGAASSQGSAQSCSAKDVHVADASSKEGDSGDEEEERELEAKVGRGAGAGGRMEDEDEDEDSTLVVRSPSLSDGKKCVHMARLYKLVSSKTWDGPRSFWYLQDLRKYDAHLFRDECHGCAASSPWLASPEAALVCIHEEVKANRSSKAVAEKAREKIFGAFRDRDLESLDVEQFARDLGIGAGNASSDSDTSSSSEEEGEDEGEDRAYGNGGSSSSSALLGQKREPTRGTGASSGSFIVVAQHKGKAFVPLRRLFEYLDQIAKTPSQMRHYMSRNCTLQRLKEHAAHMFKDSAEGLSTNTWFVSPQAALLIIGSELNAAVTSEDRAKEARAEVLRSFPGKGLEGLDLQKLARKLGVVDERVAAPHARDMVPPSSSKSTSKPDMGRRREALGRDLNGKASASKRKSGDDCDDDEGLDASSAEGSSASTSSEDEDDEARVYKNGGSSSSSGAPSQKRTPAQGTGASSGSLVVVSKERDTACVQTLRLLERLDKSGRTSKQIAGYLQSKNCYLLCLKKHEAHMFKERVKGVLTWLISPEVALLITDLELKAGKTSDDRAEEARAEIVKAFPEKNLEGLDLEKLARKLGIVDEPDKASCAHDMARSSPVKSSTKTDKGSRREAPRRGVKRKASANKRKRDSDGNNKEDLDSVGDEGARPAVATLASKRKVKAAIASDDPDCEIDESLVTVKIKAKGDSAALSNHALGFVDESGEDVTARLRRQIEHERLREELAGIKNRSAQSMLDAATAERETARAMSETYEEQLRLERLKAEKQKTLGASSKHSKT